MIVRPIKKNNLMYAGILLTWIACLFYFDPKLYSILNPSEPMDFRQDMSAAIKNRLQAPPEIALDKRRISLIGEKFLLAHAGKRLQLLASGFDEPQEFKKAGCIQIRNNHP